MPATRGQQLIALFGGKVGHDEPVDAGGSAVPGEFLQAVLQHRVEIAHEQDGNRDTVLLAQPPHHGHRIGQGHAVPQRRLTGALDRCAVGKRIGERHADLDQVRATTHHGQHPFLRSLRCWIAGGDEGHDRGAALRAGASKGVRDAARRP